ncbi:MAG: magnesium transporter CorA family protein [Chitinispirillaceae bacterium]|nr:magnesium transporter CorA family protein [Chitinispirillaceae bacterium]
MLKTYQISGGRIVESDDEQSVIHLYINPDDQERKHLTGGLKVDEHTLLSALDPNELARMEFEPEHTAIIIKRPKRYSALDNFLFKVESIGLFVFSNRLVIVISEEIPLFDGRQFMQINSIRDVILRLIYRSIFHFEEHVKVISMCSEELEGEINKATGNRQLISMFTLEKSLVYYLRAISSNGRVIDKLRLNAAKFGFEHNHLEFIEDLAIENAQCNEQAQIYSQVLASLMDARASVISNNLNLMMKNLNALVIAVAIPSFFAGVGGMSEFSDMIGFSNWKYGYGLFVCTMVLLALVIFIVIKKSEKLWSEDRRRK